MLSNINIICLLVIVASSIGGISAQLSPGYYASSCPMVFDAVGSVVKSAVAKERRMGASLLRLHFHDCFVQGCDGSILLDDTSSFTGEKTALPNNNSVRGFDVIDEIKSKVESLCPGIISCADILAIAARDSVVQLGGPYWDVKVGRRDSLTASLSAANSGVIPPPTSTLSNLINRFQTRGAHTIGQARCTLFRNRIHNETNIDSSFARTRQADCPSQNGLWDNNLAPLDLKTPSTFDNSYYKLLVVKNGLLHSDQILYNGGSTDSLVETYSEDPEAFGYDFVAAMIRMGDIGPLTGSKGQIRKNCRRVN
ncbi:Peroxidase 4 [Dorcoceras hygrometricum]|uniref:Peroxidase n=1 Tax=Dorcoceras hygrometricum TaxID=472368 RepID=A0A2Z7AWB3_9LAMI|nr:Peroxidase 4 [Dorcoceras hygrometricum]